MLFLPPTPESSSISTISPPSSSSSSSSSSLELPSSCSGLGCRGTEESAMEKGSKSFELFPSLVAQNQENEKEKEDETELTFFYGGKVYSFRNISPLQVGAILSAAEQLKEASPPPLPSVVDLVVVDDEREEKKGNYPKEVAAVVEQKQLHLPLANKASLARFLANRRKLQRVKDLDMNGDSTTSSLHFLKNGTHHLLPASKKQRQSCTTTTTNSLALRLFPL